MKVNRNIIFDQDGTAHAQKEAYICRLLATVQKEITLEVFRLLILYIINILLRVIV